MKPLHDRVARARLRKNVQAILAGPRTEVGFGHKLLIPSFRKPWTGEAAMRREHKPTPPAPGDSGPGGRSARPSGCPRERPSTCTCSCFCVCTPRAQSTPEVHPPCEEDGGERRGEAFQRKSLLTRSRSGPRRTCPKSGPRAPDSRGKRGPSWRPVHRGLKCPFERADVQTEQGSHTQMGAPRGSVSLLDRDARQKVSEQE